VTERGSTTVLLAAIAATTLLLGSAVVALHTLVTARIALQTAADAAALAAVDGGCVTAARAAAANGAAMVRCSADPGRPSFVLVRSTVGAGPFGSLLSTAGARAERVPSRADRDPPRSG
jgi:Flp pilus assembly protein TadG